MIILLMTSPLFAPWDLKILTYYDTRYLLSTVFLIRTSPWMEILNNLTALVISPFFA